MYLIAAISCCLLSFGCMAYAVYDCRRPCLKRNNLPIYFDMDGVLAVWRDVDEEKTHAPGFFLSAEADEKIVRLAKMLHDIGYDVRILSAAYTHSVRREKSKWLKRHGLRSLKKVYVPYGQPKKAYVPYGVLVDDFSENLFDWEDSSNHFAIKYYNGQNGTNGRWANVGGAAIACTMDIEELYDKMVRLSAAAEKRARRA